MKQSPQHNTFGTPAPNWADGNSRKRDGASWVPAMLVGALIFAVGCGSGLIVGWFGAVVSGYGGLLGESAFAPTELTLDVQIPDQVIADQEFELLVSITDTGSRDRSISGIYFNGTLCDNMTLVSVEPAPITSDDGPAYWNYNFDTKLIADQTVEYVFTLIPKQAGTYTGSLSMYDDGYGSEWAELSIDVEPAPDP